MTTSNITTINWESDSLSVITAKRVLSTFLQEQKEMKGKYPKVDVYHEVRILELINYIKN